MSMITPVSVQGFPQYARPWNNITPFTYRDGMTYLEVLEAMRLWLRNSLIPHVNTEMVEISEAWNAEVLALVAEIDSALSAQTTNVNNALDAHDTNVDTAIADANASFTQIQTDINARADEWMSTQISNNDSITTTLVDDPLSTTRGAINAAIDIESVGVALRNRTMLDPDNFTGATDKDKVQAAVNYAIANDYPSIGFTRIFDLTGATPVYIDKTPWYDRREIKFIGIGGGIRKDDAGAIFTSTVENTGDIALNGMKIQSIAGAGTIVFDCDKLLRISSTANDYRNVDRLARQIVEGRWIQSTRFINDHIVGGSGAAIEAIETYDTTIDNCLIEDRDAAFYNIAPNTGRLQNRNLRITSNVIENMNNTPIRLGSCWSVNIVGNYFEQNGQGKNADPAISPWVGTPAHIDMTVQDYWHAGVIIEGNMFSMRTKQKDARSVAVLLGKSLNNTPLSLRGNIADGGTLFKFVNTTFGFGTTDGSNYTEAPGVVVWPLQESKVKGIHAQSGETAKRPRMPGIGHTYLDTTTGKLIIAKTPATAAFCSLRLTSGATASGNITITINGKDHLVAVAAGDSITAVRDKVIAAGSLLFYPWNPSAGGANVVRFDNAIPGLISTAPVFAANGTGVASDYFGLDNAGANTVWVNPDGTAAV